MKYLKTFAAVLAFLSLGACATISEKMAESKGISATDCFSVGGVIDSSTGTSMCKMGDESKPVL